MEQKEADREPVLTKEDTLKETILNLEKCLLKPEVQLTPALMGELLADDFFEYGSSGNVWVREDFNQDAGVYVRDLSLYDFDIHPLSENAVLAAYRLHDKTRNQHTLRSSIWKNTDGKWRMFFHQGTVVTSK